MKFDRLVCFDLEMCCWDTTDPHRIGEIIEVGLAEADLLTGEVSQRAQYFVKPERDEVSEFCTKLTGITPRTVERQGRPLDKVLSTMTKKFGGAGKVFAAWGRDDLVLFDECRAKEVEQPFHEFLNVATVCQLAFTNGKKKLGQPAAQELLGVPWQGDRHSAFDDAFNLANLSLRLFASLRELGSSS
ncbi:MAG: 3'-5' exonuclease [Planctomycetota bacterium]